MPVADATPWRFGPGVTIDLMGVAALPQGRGTTRCCGGTGPLARRTTTCRALQHCSYKSVNHSRGSFWLSMIRRVGLVGIPGRGGSIRRKIVHIPPARRPPLRPANRTLAEATHTVMQEDRSRALCPSCSHRIAPSGPLSIRLSHITALVEELNVREIRLWEGRGQPCELLNFSVHITVDRGQLVPSSSTGG